MPKVKVFCLFYLSKIHQTESCSEIPPRRDSLLSVFSLKVFTGKYFKKYVHYALPEALGRLSGPDIITGPAI